MHLYTLFTIQSNKMNGSFFKKTIFGIVCIASVIILVERKFFQKNFHSVERYNRSFERYNRSFERYNRSVEQPGQNRLESNVTNTCKEAVQWNTWYMRSYNSRKYSNTKKIKNKKSEDSALLIVVIIYIIIILMSAFNLYQLLFVYSPFVYFIVLSINILLIDISLKLINKIDNKHFEKKNINAIISLITLFTATATFISGLLVLII
jgi:hypothetical protein